MTRPLTFCAALCAALLFTPLVRAQTDLYVGSNSSGVTTNFTSGTNAYENTFVGYDSGANSNTLNVLNPGTLLTNSGTLVVGRNGAGNSLTISNGGTVWSLDGRIGSSGGGSNNSALVTGTNSRWTMNGSLLVGQNGVGNSLVISNGGTVASGGSRIGFASISSNNSVLVVGAGSLWTNSSSIDVGERSAGNSLTVAGGGTVAASGLTIAASNGSSGTLNIGRFGTNDTGGTINAPTIAFGAGTGAINFNQSDAVTITSSISGAGTLNQLGAGTTTLSGTNTYSGMTTISDGVLQVGDGGNSGSLGSSAVVNNASLIFNRSGSLAVGGVISGAGSVRQIGAGTTTLSGTNTYSGDTTISGGTLQTADASALGTSTVQLDAGSLAPVGTLNIGSLAWNGGSIAATLGTNTSFVGIGTNFTLGAGGGSFAFTGDGSIAINTDYALLGWTNWGAITGTNFRGNALLGLDPIFTINGTNLLVNFEGATSGSILQNSSDVYTPVYANFQVSNNVTTGTLSESNTVAALTFADGSTLTVYNTLNVTNGNLTVSNGLATVTNGTLATPGDLNKLGAGTLALLGAAQIGSNAVIDAGALLVEGNVNAISDLYIGQTNSNIAMVISNGGTVANVGGYIGLGSNAANSEVVVIGAGSLWTNSGALTVGSSGVGNSLAHFQRRHGAKYHGNDRKCHHCLEQLGAGVRERFALDECRRPHCGQQRQQQQTRHFQRRHSGQ